MMLGATKTHPKVDLPDSPDLTGALKLVRIAGTGSLSVVYHCRYAENMEAAVKAITFPSGFDPTEKEKIMQKMKRGLRLWKKLEHSNIVPLLGTAYRNGFGSGHPCIVSTWMTNGTLFEYVNQRRTKLSVLDRIQLIKGSVAGLEYLHSQGIVHGNLHPDNILIDDNRNPRITDFENIHPGRALWSAPESLYPGLYPTLEFEATPQSDVYSFGSIILFTLSGQHPWKDRGEAEDKLTKFQNPPRPVWPADMSDGVWDFIERCWSPRDPRNRPLVQEVLSFSEDRLEQLLRPNPASGINVVLFGALGSGKSSIINLLSEEQVAQISSDTEPCTTRPRSYQISVDGSQIQLWDTMGFFLVHGGSTSHLSPFEQAYTVLRNLSEGVNLILLCAHKGMITSSLRRLYWLINDFFYAGRAPIAFVATHVDTSDTEWWERNMHDIARLTGIPTQSIPYACITTDRTGRDQSKHALKELLQTYATAIPPVSLRPDFSSYKTASLDLTTHCGLTASEARALVDKFRRPLRPFNIAFGEAKGPVVNLTAGQAISGV